MDIQEVSYYTLVCYQDGYWINRIFESIGCKLEEHLFTSPRLVERFLKEKFIPLMDEVCGWPLYPCSSDLEYRRHPSGAIDVKVKPSSSGGDCITISRAFQSRTVTVNKVKKVVVVDGEEYAREVEEKTYGEWKEVDPQVEVTFYRYRKGLKIVG